MAKDNIDHNATSLHFARVIIAKGNADALASELVLSVAGELVPCQERLSIKLLYPVEYEYTAW